MLTLSLTTLDAQILAETLCRAIMDTGARLKATDKLHDVDNYRNTKNDFDVLCSLHAKVCPPAARDPQTLDAISDLERWRTRDSDALAAAPYDAQRAEGVDPYLELMHMDPRAIRPNCVHGIPFSEPCAACDLPATTPLDG